jgi:tetratricopeptide (TPR) repeat protein/outer membrane protein assembly factor BamB
LLLLGFLAVLAFGEESGQTTTGLPVEADREVTRYMNLLIQDPRNDFLFGEVFRIYKTHKAEYRLLGFLKGSIKAKPDEKSLWILLGLAYREFRDYFLAKKYFNKAIELDPGDYFPRYLAAQVLLREGKTEEAITGLRQAVDLAADPEDKLRAREELAGAFLTRAGPGDIEKAGAELDAILKEREFDLEAHWRVARIYEDHRLYEQAIQRLGKLIEVAGESEPDMVCRAWMRTGDIYQASARRQEAIDAYLKARGLVDDQHWLAERISAQVLGLYRQTGQTEAWSRELAARIEERPRDIELRKELARALAAAGKGEEAYGHLKAAAEVAPDDVSVLEEIIRLKSSEADGAIDEATRQKLYAQLPPWYQRLREINDENLDTIVREGEAWRKAGDESKAAEVWQNIVRGDEAEIRRFDLLGKTLLRHKRLESGIEALRKGLALDPARDDLRMQIAEVLLTEGKIEEAQREFQAIIERGAATEVTYLRIAALYEQINRQDRVLSTLEEAAGKFPDSYDIQLRLGTLCLDSPKPEERAKARETLWRAFLTGPTPRARLLANLKLQKAYPYGELGARMRQHVAEHPEDLTALMAVGDIETRYEGDTGVAGRKIELTGMGATGEGQLAYKTVQAKDPLYLAAYEHNASLLIAADRFEDAVLEYRKMAVVNPVNKWAYWLRIGDLFADQGQMEEANVYWDFIRERNISDPQILYQLGARMLRAERYADARSLIERAAELHPNDYRLQLSLGHLYEHFESYEKAVHAYTRAIQLATSDLVLPVRIHLGRIQRRYGEQLWTQGRTEGALGVYQSSQAFLEKLKEITGETSPEYPNVMVQVARCLESLGRGPEAAEAYRAAAGGFPETWVWVNSTTEAWLPFFERLRAAGKHAFPAEQPELRASVGKKVAAQLVGQVWPVTQILASHAEPGRIQLVGMDSLVTINTADMTSLQRPLALSFEQRVRTLLFPPFLALQPLAAPREPQEFNPKYLKTVAEAAPSLEVYQLDSLAKVGAFVIGGIEPWPVQQGNRLYFLSPTGAGRLLLGYDLATGKPLWSAAEAFRSESARVVVGSDRYLAVTECTDESVQFRVLDAATGKLVATIDPGTFHFWRNPVILADTLISYDDFDGILVAWRLPDGQPLYRVRFGNQLAAELQPLDANTVFVHHRLFKERDIALYAIDAGNGQAKWRTRLNLESIDRGPVIAGQRLLYVYRYRPEKVDEPAYDKPGPFYRAGRGVLVLDSRSGEKLSEIDLTKLLAERTIQEIRDAFCVDDHLFLVTHSVQTFKFRLQDTP